jgi:hypothetical protein
MFAAIKKMLNEIKENKKRIIINEINFVSALWLGRHTIP